MLRVLSLALALVTLLAAPVALATTGPISHCAAAASLLSHDDLAAAKSEYEAALVDDVTRKCGAKGLIAVQTKAGEQKRISPADAGNALLDELLDVAWPWIAALLLLRLILELVRGYLRKPRRISVSAPTDQKDFATAVIRTASAAGKDSRRSLKVMTAADAALPSSSVADVSKLLSLPGSAPLQAILDLSVGATLANRLEVSCAMEGGWATAELVLRHPGHRKIRERIALPLGEVDKKVQEATLALVAGAWLVAVEDEDSDHGDTPQARLAYALFRAGAYLQLNGRLILRNGVLHGDAQDRYRRGTARLDRVADEHRGHPWALTTHGGERDGADGPDRPQATGNEAG